MILNWILLIYCHSNRTHVCNAVPLSIKYKSMTSMATRVIRYLISSDVGQRYLFSSFVWAHWFDGTPWWQWRNAFGGRNSLSASIASIRNVSRPETMWCNCGTVNLPDNLPSWISSSHAYSIVSSSNARPSMLNVACPRTYWMEYRDWPLGKKTGIDGFPQLNFHTWTADSKRWPCFKCFSLLGRRTVSDDIRNDGLTRIWISVS